MDQQTLDLRLTALEGEPPLREEPIPLRDQVTLYFRPNETNPRVVQHLVFKKSFSNNGRKDGDNGCDVTEQNRILGSLNTVCQDPNHPWDPNEMNHWPIHRLGMDATQ